LAEADDDDFENAWASVEAPAGAEAPWSSPKQPVQLQPLPPEPDEPEPPSPPAPSSPPVPAAAARPAARKRPAVPAPVAALDEEEPVMVTAELVLRRSNQRARLTAAAVAIAAVAALVGGGVLALRWKRDAAVPGEPVRKVSGAASSDVPAGALSAADLAKLMGKKAPDPAEAAAPVRPAAAAPAEDRPKHEKLSRKDKGLLDLLSKKGDAAVTVQDDDAAALATSRGALDARAVEGTIARNGGSFSACVSRAMAVDPSQKLNGKRVTLELTVRPSGRVAKATLAEVEIARTPLGQCIAQAAKRMVFPGFDGAPIDISAPLVLKVVY
jgi:hypothetical protein